MTWYDAPSHAAGAALVEELTGALTDSEIRATGVRVGRSGAEDAAGDHVLWCEIEAADPAGVRSFWRTVLGYDGTDQLVDPLRRNPAFSVRRLAGERPLRNRIHVDVVRPANAVDRARAATGRTPTGPYGVMLPDDEGNEVDLVPGDPLDGTSDWLALFGAMTFYPTSNPAPLVTVAAELADAAGVPLMIDVRPEGVVFDSGKDQWEENPKFLPLAQQLEAAAHELGLQADPTRLRFVQFGIDAIDVPEVLAFWAALLGYEQDPRAGVSDLYDPRRLNPVLFFQQMQEPREQRNRIRFGLTVPEPTKTVESALAAGGRLLAESPYLVADPEGNEVVINA
ncbi:VOC family protein [Kribbella sp. NPDC048915]|uniref:VOC family protein n=1 Tax=Kribbella sp. NPDC048915 TaxID=3155148 RepID=UPI00340C2153